MPDLSGKTLFITGASRGIGKSIAMRAAGDGANIVVAAKTTEPHPRLPGTIYTAADEIEAAGGRALPMTVDVRDLDAMIAAVEKAKTAFGGIDILVNNASAISLTGTLETPMKRFDLMFSVNVRATFACSQACLPHLKCAQNPHILNLAPPLDMRARWFKDHCAYTMSKYGMSMCVLGMAEEFKQDGVAVNALWPRTVINTAAVAMLGGPIKPANCRTPEIVAEAAYVILTRDAKTCTGNFFIDAEVLAEEGIRDLERYAVTPGAALVSDLFVE
ncbi:MAG: NAD(P)-dependent oxidoreductase [Gammaproteobacteria bacterium]|nr:NAD(P)-dependent oxidoreductase [Gammaproteobacteria bacterium]